MTQSTLLRGFWHFRVICSLHLQFATFNIDAEVSSRIMVTINNKKIMTLENISFLHEFALFHQSKKTAFQNLPVIFSATAILSYLINKTA